MTAAKIISSETQYLIIPCDPIDSDTATRTAGEAEGESKTELNMYPNAFERYVGRDNVSCRDILISAEEIAERYEGTSATLDLRSGGEARRESRIVGRLERMVGWAEVESEGGGVSSRARSE